MKSTLTEEEEKQGWYIRTVHGAKLKFSVEKDENGKNKLLEVNNKPVKIKTKEIYHTSNTKNIKKFDDQHFGEKSLGGLSHGDAIYYNDSPSASRKYNKDNNQYTYKTNLKDAIVLNEDQFNDILKSEKDSGNEYAYRPENIRETMLNYGVDAVEYGDETAVFNIDKINEDTSNLGDIDSKYKRINDELQKTDKYNGIDYSKNNEEIIQPDKVWDDDFTQKSTNPLYSDTNYTKEEFDKMSDNGIKPLEESYSGRGWEGKKYDSNLSTKEIAKNISDYAKKEFPGVKISRHTDYDAIDFTITSSDKDIYIDEKGIDKLSDDGVLDLLRNGQNVFFNRWAKDNVPGYKEKSTFETNDVRRYIKEDLQRIKNRPNQYVSGNEYYLSDYGKDVISKLNKEMNSYNYDDSDAMTDYFDTNFYGRVNIGSYEKPYKYEEK